MAHDSLANKVYEEIRRRILTGEIKSGDRLTERALREYYGSSRTPIREALKMLERDGWLRAFPKKGTFVAGLELEQIREIYQVRTALEPAGILLATPRISVADRKLLQDYYVEMREALDRGDIEGFTMKDAGIHLFIAERSGNRILANVVRDLTGSIIRLGSAAISLPERQSVSLHEWGRLIEALMKGDSFDASNWMIQHLMNSSDAALKALGQNSQGGRE